MRAALGFMTRSSVLLLARGKPLSPARIGVLRAGFSLPHYFTMHHFLVHVIVFTAQREILGAPLEPAGDSLVSSARMIRSATPGVRRRCEQLFAFFLGLTAAV